MRHFLSLKDFSKAELYDMLCLSLTLKSLSQNAKNLGKSPTPQNLGFKNIDFLPSPTLALILEKPSTRTRVSFEAGAYELGGKAIILMGKDTQISRGEPIKDSARVISSMVDIIAIRTFSHDGLEEFARYSIAPVINALTDLSHPLQVMADMLTMIECGIYAEDFALHFDLFAKKYLQQNALDLISTQNPLPRRICDTKNPIVTYIGDGNNMAHSWLKLAGILGFELRVLCPQKYAPDKKIIALAQNLANTSNAKIHIEILPQSVSQKEVQDTLANLATSANVLTTDTWISMGQEEEKQDRIRAFEGFCINQALMQKAHSNAIFLHCLPAYRGYEVSEEVIEGAQSRVWQEANNRLHIQKGIMLWLLATKSH
ncbi:ornithine carbamoyltransferase [Helicobacter sp. T3_23-1056]